ncbi:MAG: DOMON domain-containing protein [Anaerolineae bacterium]|jgi:hypothetical protein|nr:hypothetical protein [Chloroflexota bacterium]
MFRRTFSYLLVALLLAACQMLPPIAPPHGTPTDSRLTESAPVAVEPATRAASPSLDGAMVPGVYDHQMEVAGVSLSWSNSDQVLYLAAACREERWLGIGLAGQEGLQGANLLIAARRQGRLSVWDGWCEDAAGTLCSADVDLGGSDDRRGSSSFLLRGGVMMEVRIPLDSGDRYDNPLVPGGTYPVVIATGRDLEFALPPAQMETVTITLDGSQ